MDRPLFSFFFFSTGRLLQSAQDGVLRSEKGVHGDVSVGRFGRMQDGCDDCLADVGQEGEIRFCGAVVVYESRVRCKVEAEELGLDGPDCASYQYEQIF